MRFLVDENLPSSVGTIFTERGWHAECVSGLVALRGQSDEAVFEYAVKNRMVIVTRDLRFTDPTQFALHEIPGIMIVRFPNDVSIDTLCIEAKRLIHNLYEDDFRQIVVIEPGSVRIRSLSQSKE